MKLFIKYFTRRNRWRRSGDARLAMESCEARFLPSAVWPGVSELVSNDTISTAEDLGPLSNGAETRASGVIGDAPSLGADVDWYQFTLGEASRVAIAVHSGAMGAPGNFAVSLYNNTPLEFDDQFNLQGHRLLAQSENTGESGNVDLTRELAAGTYFIAVSGAGNLAFNPFVAESGYPGATGDYELVVSDTSLGLGAADGPVVLNSEPAANQVLDTSPLILRISFSSALEPGSIAPDDTLQLIQSQNDTFGDDDDVVVPLALVSFSQNAYELQLTPAAPLEPAHYQLFLAGDRDLHPNVLADLNGHPLGADSTHASGRDIAIRFDINGIEGHTGDAPSADDTPTASHDLGDITQAGLIHVSGVIGDDPYYNQAVDFLLNPANDVDMYHFRISGSGSYALNAEVFAGRIGSPLDSGVSLFRKNPETGRVEFVAGNNNTYNPLVDENGNLPLFYDSALFAQLTEGDYYVAVSSAFNTPSPAEQQLPESEGMFNPNVSHSGALGMNTGPYQLNLQIGSDSIPPSVISTTPRAGSALAASPDRLVIQFSESVNLQQLAFDAYRQPTTAHVASVYVQAEDGTKFFPRLESFDPATNRATFLMLDRLPDGLNVLHLSGALGLTDLSGNPLNGNDPSGDYVIDLHIAASIRATAGNGKDWIVPVPATDASSRPDAQDLGTLFPREWQAGITLTRTPNMVQNLRADVYQFKVLQSQDYFFSLGGDGLPGNARIALTDLDGNLVPGIAPNPQTLQAAAMPAGSYLLWVEGWAPRDAVGVHYQVRMTFLNIADNAPPLTSGPTPYISIRLVTTVDPTPAPVQGAQYQPAQPLPSMPFIPTSSLSGAISSGTGTAGGNVSVQPVSMNVNGLASSISWGTSDLFGSTNSVSVSSGSGSVTPAVRADRPAALRIVLPGQEDAVLPASQSTYGDGEMEFSAVRNIRILRGPEGKKDLKLGGLADLADAPVGHDSKQAPVNPAAEAVRNLMHKLTKLIADQQANGEPEGAAPGSDDSPSEAPLPAIDRPRISPEESGPQAQAEPQIRAGDLPADLPHTPGPSAHATPSRETSGELLDSEEHAASAPPGTEIASAGIGMLLMGAIWQDLPESPPPAAVPPRARRDLTYNRNPSRRSEDF